MRINLVTPFAEKDAVKALGAKWDPAKKLWYVTDVADLGPFMRWIPNQAAAVEEFGGATHATTSKIPARQSAGVITKSTIEVPHCSCEVPPWEHCEHTAKQTKA